LSFYSIDLAGNVNLSDEEYTKALNTPVPVSNGGNGKSDIRVYNNTTSNSNGAVQLFNELVNGTQSPTSNSSNNCAYNPSTGQLDPSIYSLDLASKLSDVIIPKVANSAFSCTVSVRYDAEAPLNYASGAPGGNVIGSGNVGGTTATPVSTSNLGIRTGISNITSSSYKNVVKVKDSNGVEKDVEQLVSIPDFANSEFNQGTSNNKNTAITRDTQVQVTTTAEARADMVYTLNSGFGDSINVLIQDNTLNPNGAVVNTGVGGLGGSVGTGSSYKEFGSTLDIKSSKNQQSKQVVLKQDPTKVLLDKNAPFEWYYFFQSVDKSAVKVEPGRISNTTRVLQNGEQDNPTRTTSFTLARNSTVRDNKLKRDEDGSKKVSGGNGECTRVTNEAITTSTLGTIPATVNRRVGVCDDGMYKVNSYAVDSSGNYAKDSAGLPVVVSKVMERDTVSPSKPTLEVNHVLDSVDQGQAASVRPNFLGMKVVGEANSYANIEVVSSSNFNQKINLKLGANGIYQTNDLVGSLPCGEILYTVKVKLTDRAGNVSEVSDSKSFKTKQCAVCAKYQLVGLNGRTFQALGENAKGFVNPTGRVMQPGYIWGYSESYGSDRHSGVDYPIGTGEAVFAAKAGKVIQAHQDPTTTWGTPGSLTTIIDHGAGVFSAYYHQSAFLVTEGQQVTTGQQIGLAGATGYAKGAHLHFEVRLNSPAFGNDVEPTQFINGSLTVSSEIKAVETVKSNSVSKVNKISNGNISPAQSSYLNCSVPDLAEETSDEGYDGIVKIDPNAEPMGLAETSEVAGQLAEVTNSGAKKVFEASSLCMNSFSDILPKLSFENAAGILKYAVDNSVEALANEVLNSCGLNRAFIDNVENLKAPEYVKSILRFLKDLFFAIIKVIDFVLTPIRYLVKQFQNPNVKDITKMIGSIIITVTMSAICGTIVAASAGLFAFLVLLCGANVFASVSLFNNVVDLLACIGSSESDSPACVDIVKTVLIDAGLLVILGGIFKFISVIASKPFVKNVGSKVFDSVNKKFGELTEYVCSPKTKICSLPGQCFVAGTMILVALASVQALANSGMYSGSGGSGYNTLPVPTKYNTTSKPIELIKKGDLVVSRDQYDLDDDKPKVFSRVTRTFQKETNILQSISTIDKDGKVNSIVTTPEHPFYDSKTKGWLSSKGLEVGSTLGDVNSIVKSDKTKSVINSNTSIVTEIQLPTKVYNFEVSGTHTYYLGDRFDGGVWVHNSCNPVEVILTSGKKLSNTQGFRSSDDILHMIESEVKIRADGTKVLQGGHSVNDLSNGTTVKYYLDLVGNPTTDINKAAVNQFGAFKGQITNNGLDKAAPNHTFYPKNYDAHKIVNSVAEANSNKVYIPQRNGYFGHDSNGLEIQIIKNGNNYTNGYPIF
jgi:murein DD-endopeptidase MepM/ murein hydrolase activator NlpD